MRVISLAGWVGFLRSQIWTPALVLRLTRMDSMEWMLWLVPRVLMPFILQPGRETLSVLPSHTCQASSPLYHSGELRPDGDSEEERKSPTPPSTGAIAD